ncbi:hypothetical protein T440DRAFT_465850 [Plenodomus tracheiphilus IPT5]|uniref:Uncharacterized protein n=1 Tax=Plenodomus tracheiphilus IPT5 TaxID=1408161 RepID=A0A6A7BDN6_9PLEO|nr:hypothetical protein T440DRAFT_465850 [Plenodomus tracheiphilus IPT5]
MALASLLGVSSCVSRAATAKVEVLVEPDSCCPAVHPFHDNYKSDGLSPSPNIADGRLESNLLCQTIVLVRV